MTQFVCRCLNVTIKCDPSHAEAVDLEKIGLTSAEQRDSFFREQLLLFTKADVQMAQEVLVECQPIKGFDNWIIYSCLNCNMQTHAVFMKGNIYKYIVKSSCMTTPQSLAAVLKNDNYSPVFKLLVEEKEELDNVKLPTLPEKTQSTIGCLSRQLTKSLRSQLEAIEEEIRILRDKKYAEFECFREKAHRDHKILTSIAANKSDRSVKEDAPNWFPMDLGASVSPQRIPLSTLPPQPRARLSSFKGSKIKQNTKLSVTVVSAKDDSIDSDGIFDFEGMDSETPPHNGGHSDTYFSDSDDSVSRDEGIQVARGKKNYKRYIPVRSNLAKSLPMNMPTFNKSHDIPQDEFEDDEEVPTDIAASIKALARSVHGGDIFGELPRPRFSTLI